MAPARKPISLERGHEYAASIINAYLGGELYRFNGNVPNTGLVTNLPAGACVEVPVLASRKGFEAGARGGAAAAVRRAHRAQRHDRDDGRRGQLDRRPGDDLSGHCLRSAHGGQALAGRNPPDGRGNVPEEPAPPPAIQADAELVNDPASRICCGVAGWSYPDWEGYVYDRREKDKLAFVAGYVDMIEINSSFYSAPSASDTASWVKRTSERPGFSFSAKLHQDVTHGGMIEPALIRRFREGFAPMVEARRLRHLLAQFRYDFVDNLPAREHLSRIREAFGDMANLTLELRHVSWQAPDALNFLRTLRATVAVLDYPLGQRSFNLRVSGVGEHAYLRLHGRNVKAWFGRGSGRDETYNYLYSRHEVEGIRDRALEIARMSASLTVVANNHYQGKEAANALQLKALLSGGRVPVPPLLESKYPHLREISAPRDFESLIRCHRLHNRKEVSNALQTSTRGGRARPEIAQCAAPCCGPVARRLPEHRRAPCRPHAVARPTGAERDAVHARLLGESNLHSSARIAVHWTGAAVTRSGRL